MTRGPHPVAKELPRQVPNSHGSRPCYSHLKFPPQSAKTKVFDAGIKYGDLTDRVDNGTPSITSTCSRAIGLFPRAVLEHRSTRFLRGCGPTGTGCDTVGELVARQLGGDRSEPFSLSSYLMIPPGLPIWLRDVKTPSFPARSTRGITLDPARSTHTKGWARGCWPNMDRAPKISTSHVELRRSCLERRNLLQHRNITAGIRLPFRFARSRIPPVTPQQSIGMLRHKPTGKFEDYGHHDRLSTLRHGINIILNRRSANDSTSY